MAFGRPGATVTLGGNDFGAPGTVADSDIAVSLCTTAGGSCEPIPESDDTLSADSAGVLSGTVVIPSATTARSGILRVTTPVEVAQVPFTVLGTRTWSASPAYTSPGYAVALTGSNFNPGEALAWSVLPAAGGTAVLGSATAASATGIVNVTFPAPTSGDYAIELALSGTPIPPATPAAPPNDQRQALTVTFGECTAVTGGTGGGSCDFGQELDLDVTPGNLSIGTEVSDNGTPGDPSDDFRKTVMDFGTTPSASAPASLLTAWNDITVTDARAANSAGA